MLDGFERDPRFGWSRRPKRSGVTQMEFNIGMGMVLPGKLNSLGADVNPQDLPRTSLGENLRSISRSARTVNHRASTHIGKREFVSVKVQAERFRIKGVVAFYQERIKPLHSDHI